MFEIIENEEGVPVNLSLHFSSGNDFENITAEMIPEGFNSDYFTGSFDERSDAKGPEPEALTVGECENGRLYVFVALERVGGIMVYDFTDIDNVVFADYVNNRNFSANFSEAMEEALIRPPDNAGDIGPEHLKFIPGYHYGEALLLVSNPQSASITMYRVDCGDTPYTTPEPNGEGQKGDGELSLLEWVAIGVAALVIVSLAALVIWCICCKRTGARWNTKKDNVQLTESGGRAEHVKVATEADESVTA